MSRVSIRDNAVHGRPWPSWARKYSMKILGSTELVQNTSIGFFQDIVAVNECPAKGIFEMRGMRTRSANHF